jgi:hypothetical protein
MAIWFFTPGVSDRNLKLIIQLYLASSRDIIVHSAICLHGVDTILTNTKGIKSEKQSSLPTVRPKKQKEVKQGISRSAHETNFLVKADF